VTDPGTDVATRARALALAQGSNAQIAGGLLVEFGLSWDAAMERVTAMSEELQHVRWAGQMLGKERLFRLMSGEDLGKIRGEHLTALDTFCRSFCGLTEREDTAKIIEAAAAKLAKDAGRKLKVA
jgi:hypothetical protein